MCFPSYSLSTCTDHLQCGKRMRKAWSILSRDINVYLGRQSGGRGPRLKAHILSTFFFILTLCFCILQPTQNWTMGRLVGLGARLLSEASGPGSEAIERG